jgi:class 3 adenylate cyclase
MMPQASTLGEDLAARLFERKSLGTITWRDLAESEQLPWRQRAEQALHALAALGCRIEQSADPVNVESAAELAAQRVRDAIRDAEQLLRMGEPLLAYNTIQQALVDRPREPRLRQLKGLALARSGALHRANEELAKLRDEGFTDGETLGLLARTHKDLALAAEDLASREQHLAAAFDIYATGYRESARRGAVADAYYTGINAATMAFLHGHVDTAREIAADVEELCEVALQDAGGDVAEMYWPQATLAEAALILGNKASARERYATAATLIDCRYGDLSSTRHQARLLLAHMGESGDWLDEVMQVPPVLVYTGHMIDAPGRAQPRFTPQMEAAVRADIFARLKHLRPVAAYGSAACGADILCLECVRELGGELHIVLPFPVEEFRSMSVDLRPEGAWGERFDRLLECANEVLVTGEQPPEDGVSTFEYANLVITGLGHLRAQMLDTQLHGLAVWDGTSAGDVGGTGSVVSMWRETGVPLEHVEIPAARALAGGGADVAGPPARTVAQWDFEYAIKAMLFADAVGYSRLSEAQIPRFFEHYVGTVAAFNESTDYKAVHIETAGDGMYMVFDDAETAGHYALDLSELINRQDWSSVGLPADLKTRIGLHCGPVFVGRDPITGASLYSGVHTSRTARIEPITPPGQVYASSAFAAVATAQKASELRFSYIGRTQLAKHYGVLPLHHVRRREHPWDHRR